MSVHSRVSRSNPKARSSISSMHVAFSQIMHVSRTLKLPMKSTCCVSQTVAKLELFCLQKVFNGIVFLDSIVLQCQLMMEDESIMSPVRLDDIGWTQWTPDTL